MEVLGGGSLQISNLTEEDAGIYTCMADNGNATIEAQAQLTLQGTLSSPHCLLYFVGPKVQTGMQPLWRLKIITVPQDLNQAFIITSQPIWEHTQDFIFLE